MYFLRRLLFSFTCLSFVLSLPHLRILGSRALLSLPNEDSLERRLPEAAASNPPAAPSVAVSAAAITTAAAATTANASTTSDSAPAAVTSFGPEGEFINGALQVSASNDVEEQDEEENSQQTTCKSANDCDALCTSKEANVTSTPLSTCNFGGLDNGVGICQCADGTVLSQLIGQALAGIGEVACQVFNKGLSLGVDIATAVIDPEALAVGAAEKAAVGGLTKALKEGGNSGVFNFCQGVNFTVVPSTILNNIPRATILPY